MTVRVLTAPNPGPFTLDGTKTYLFGDRAVLDPGPIIDSHLDAILSLAPRLQRILVTHRHTDHAPGAVPLRDRTGAEIWAPRGAFDDGVAQRVLMSGQRLEAGDVALEVIATPGHTAEHVCFLDDDGGLFTGDTVLGQGTTVVLPPDGDMGDYIGSLRALRARNPRRIYPGHGPIRDDAVALLDEYIAHRLQREAQVVEALTAGARSVGDLRERIYPDLEPGLRRAAEAQIEAHLALLERRGRVVREGDSFALAG